LINLSFKNYTFKITIPINQRNMANNIVI